MNFSDNAFKLANGDVYEQRCCEIFITRAKILVFHCSMCDGIYGSFKDFLKHLLNKHCDESLPTRATKSILPSPGSKTRTSGSLDRSTPQQLLSHICSTQEEDEGSHHDAQDPAEITHNQNREEEAEESTEIMGFCVVDENVSEPEKECIVPVEQIDVTELYDAPEDQEEIGRVVKEEPSSVYSKTTDLPKVYSCTQCKRKFTIESVLKKHIERDHTTERKYKCDICGIAFTLKGNLNTHIRRHSANQKRYPCPMCSHSFHTRPELDTHVRRHTGDRPYICTQCGKGYIVMGLLTEHMKRHTNERPYRCEYCDKSFFNRHSLKRHLPIHKQERNCVCSECGASFKIANTLREHKKLHANKRQYKCDFCECAFNQKAALFTHEKTKHKVLSNKTPVRLTDNFNTP